MNPRHRSAPEARGPAAISRRAPREAGSHCPCSRPQPAGPRCAWTRRRTWPRANRQRGAALRRALQVLRSCRAPRRGRRRRRAEQASCAAFWSAVAAWLGPGARRDRRSTSFWRHSFSFSLILLWPPPQRTARRPWPSQVRWRPCRRCSARCFRAAPARRRSRLPGKEAERALRRPGWACRLLQAAMLAQKKRARQRFDERVALALAQVHALALALGPALHWRVTPREDHLFSTGGPAVPTQSYRGFPSLAWKVLPFCGARLPPRRHPGLAPARPLRRPCGSCRACCRPTAREDRLHRRILSASAAARHLKSKSAAGSPPCPPGARSSPSLPSASPPWRLWRAPCPSLPPPRRARALPPLPLFCRPASPAPSAALSFLAAAAPPSNHAASMLSDRPPPPSRLSSSSSSLCRAPSSLSLVAFFFFLMKIFEFCAHFYGVLPYGCGASM